MMLETLDLKAAFAFAAFAVGALAYVPYLRDMLAGRTKPHAYTWLIWSITLVIATAGVWYGGSLYTATTLTILTGLTFCIFLLSLRFGTRNVTRGDTVLLALALAAVVPWVFFKNPAFSVLMVTAIDTAGYIPSMRKSYGEPWSESLVSWAMFTVTGMFLILSLSEYTILTVTYVGVSMIANLILIGICLTRRQVVPRPAKSAT